MKSTDFEKMTDAEKRNYIKELEKRIREPLIIGYARVSTKNQERDGNSLEAQKVALREAGASLIFEDTYTGTSKDRPGLKNLLLTINPGDTFVTTKLDRIARSVRDGIELLNILLDMGVKINILNIGVIDNSPTGNLTRNILLSFAEFERDLILERTQEGKELARRKPGFRDGRPPKYSVEQIEHAVDLLMTYSYKQVANMTGISVSTLVRYRAKIINNEKAEKRSDD